jgi:threonine dehydrogenase-like Zn-dependent dehydrogenase
MRALIYDGREVALRTGRADPVPRAGEAVVRTLRALVTAADAQPARGFSGVLGHQFVGRVESVEGKAPAGLVGARVVGSSAIVCGTCDLCSAGLSEHCRHRMLMGIEVRDGCLADRFAIPAQNLVVVPDAIDDDHALFAELLASAMQAVRQLTISGKPYITVLGDGPLGLLAAQLMVPLNASVRLIGFRADNLALCEKWRIKHRLAVDVGRRADQDVVVETTGTAAGFDLATRMVRPRGTIVLKAPFVRVAGGPPDAPGPDLDAIVRAELTIIGSHRGPIAEAVAALGRRAVDVVSLITKRMRLDDGPAIIAAAAAPGALAVVVNVELERAHRAPDATRGRSG